MCVMICHAVAVQDSPVFALLELADDSSSDCVLSSTCFARRRITGILLPHTWEAVQNTFRLHEGLGSRLIALIAGSDKRLRS
jgi:hypothetical protein